MVGPRIEGALRSFVDAIADSRADDAGAFQSLFDASPLPLIVTAADSGEILDVNVVTESLSGFPRAHLRGRSVQDFGPYRDAGDGPTPPTGADGATVSGREVRFRNARGRELRLLAHSSPITLAGRECLLTAFTNITTLTRMEDGLLAAQRMEVVGRLSGGIAHEFNNLLTVMQGHLDALSDDTATQPSLRARVDALGRAVGQATRITSGLLTFAGRNPTAADTVDMNAAIDGLRTIVTGTLGDTIEVSWALEASPATVRIPHGHVAQVVFNLTLNAREAMPDGGRLSIGTSYEPRTAPRGGTPEGPWVRVHVRDTGRGMSDDVRRYAFEPFFTTKGPGQGTGLGLSICRGIAEQAGGKITVHSVAGGGTTVYLYLPFAETAPSAPALAPPPRVDGRQPRVVLLVEDEADVRHIVSEILRRAGHSVHAADGLASAEQLLGQLGHPIDVLITDLVLPGGNGLEVARRVRSRQPGVPVLYMSGYSENVFAGGHRVEHLLQKPFTSRTLLDTLDALFTT